MTKKKAVKKAPRKKQATTKAVIPYTPRPVRRKGKAVSIVSAFDDIRADYDMSRENRFIRRRTGLAPQGNTADWHYRNEESYYRDIEKARDMDRNDSIIGQTIDRAVDNIVQDGFTLDPKTGSQELDKILRRKWHEWAEDREACDIQGEFCWHDFERHAMRSMLVDGDIVFLGLGGDDSESGKLQAIEAHAIRTSTRQDNTVLGVTKDDFGKRLQYWITHDPIEPNEQKESAQPVDVRDANGMRTLFHVYRPDRTSQTRGVTALAPVFAVAGMRDDIQFAKLVQQQVASCFAIFRKRQYIPNDPHSITPGYGAGESETSPTGETRYIENIAPGMEIIGQAGEELQGFSPDVPGQGYEFQFKEMLTTIGVNLGLPLCLVLMDGSETNFSGWRGAVDEARKGFRVNQRNLIERFHSPVYRWKLSHWLDDPEIQAILRENPNIRFSAHKWNAPTWQYIDPVGDAQGDMLRLQNTLSSPRRLHAERGAPWEEIATETVEDKAFAVRLAKQTAQKINSEFNDGQPVQWRELINLPMPQGVQMTMADPMISGKDREEQLVNE